MWRQQRSRFYQEQYESAEAIRNSETRYRRLFEAARDGILILDFNTGMIVDANPFLIEMLGYTHEQFLGKKLWEVGFIKDIVANEEKFLELRQKEYVRYEDLPLETADGQKLEVEFVSNVYLVDHHKVIQCNVRDITEREQSKEALRESEERFRTLFEQAAVGVALLETKTGKYKRVNQKYCDFLGYTIEEISHRTFQEVTYADDIQTNMDNNALLIAGKIREFSNEKRYIRKDGTVVWGNLTASPLWKPGAEPDTYFHIAVVEDITERKQAENALREAAIEREKLIQELQFALDNVKTLQGLIPICANCKKIRDDKGFWNQVEGYISQHTDVKFTHGICPDCAKKLYGDFYEKTLKTPK